MFLQSYTLDTTAIFGLLPLVLFTPAPLRLFLVPLGSPDMSSTTSSLDLRFLPTIAAEEFPFGDIPLEVGEKD